MLEQFRTRQHAADIPRLRCPVIGVVNGSDKPKRIRNPRRNPQEMPYYQRLCGFLRYYKLPEPTPEYRFAAPRLFRFDFAWPRAMLAIEVDGGLFVNGGHNRGAALLKQYEKQNLGVLLGWKILRYSPDQLSNAARDVRAILAP
jgi:hypothetical protein